MRKWLRVAFLECRPGRIEKKLREKNKKRKQNRFYRLSHIHHVRWCRCERQKKIRCFFWKPSEKGPLFLQKQQNFFCRSHLHHRNHERKGKGIRFIVLYQPKCSRDLPSLALRPVHTDTILIPLGIFQSRIVWGIFTGVSIPLKKWGASNCQKNLQLCA